MHRQRPAAAGTSGTWRRSRSARRSRCSLRTPFFPARHAGLPDLVGQLLSRVAELEVDGPELLRLRAHPRPAPPSGEPSPRSSGRSSFRMASMRSSRVSVGGGGSGSCRHGATPGVKKRGGFPTALQPTTPAAEFPTQGQPVGRRIAWTSVRRRCQPAHGRTLPGRRSWRG